MDKKALSNLIAYVMLIAITLSLSVMVYGWMKFYVSGEDVPACSDNVNVIISSYECVNPAAPGGILNVTIKNRGLFNIDGYVLRVHNRSDAEFGFYVFNATGSALKPGESVLVTYNFPGVDDITFIDVQPFVKDGDDIACESYASQRAVCS